jgi:urease accessory protein
VATLTRTCTETSIRVERVGPDARVRVITQVNGGPERPTIRPVLVQSSCDGATISLVPEGALLLDGDAVSLLVWVGEGVSLHLVEPAGTVAYDMRGGSATWEVSVDVAPGGSLIWDGEPFVAAAGSDTCWSAGIRLAQDARLRWRETLVLGRHGEGHGRLRHSLSVHQSDGTPILLDAFDSGPTSSLALGGHRVIGSTLLIGMEEPGVAGTRFVLETGGVLVRSLANEMHLL